MKTLVDREDLVFGPPELGCVLSLTGRPGGSHKIYDRSPYGRIGTITGATWKRLPGGLWYLYFDGDDRVTIPMVVAVPNVSIAVWFKPSSDITTLQGVMCGRNSGIWVESSTLRVFHQAQNFGGTVPITANVWSFLVARFEGLPANPTVDISLNGGAFAASGVSSNTDELAATDGIRLGVRNSANSSPLTGSVARPRLLENQLLSELEARSIFDQEKSLFGVW